MGIYDREYYRREHRGFLGSMAGRGQVTKWLVLTNVAVYIIQLITNNPQGPVFGWFTDILVMKPDRVVDSFQIWRLLTGAFLHDPRAWEHIVWNMLFLWFFGPDIEEIYGQREFLYFYLTAGILGNLFWGVTTLMQEPLIDRFGQPFYPPALGASGAVLAVIVLCALHYPHRTILVMFVLPVPLWLWAVVLVAADLYHFLQMNVHTGVAVAAHLGGAGFGFLYYRLQWRLGNLFSGLASLRRRASRPGLRVYRETPVSAGSPDEQLEAKADAILAKVHQRGMASLSDEEREILKQASEQFKKRRT